MGRTTRRKDASGGTGGTGTVAPVKDKARASHLTGGALSSDGTAKGSPATRLAILEAATDVLDSKGVFDATVGDFVRQAGIAQGTFYIYFTDKFDLLKELCAVTIDRLFEQTNLGVDHSLSPYKRIEASLIVIFRSWEAHVGLLRSLYQLAAVRPDFKQFQVALGQPFKERMYREISSSIARGRVHPVDARVASEALGTLISSICMNWFGLNLPPYPGALIPDVAAQLALLWYRALYAKDPPELALLD